MKDTSHQGGTAPTAQAFLNSIDQLAQDDNRLDAEGDGFQKVRPGPEAFMPAPGFGVKDMSAVSAMVGSRRKLRLLEKSVRAPLEEAASSRAVNNADASAIPAETKQQASAEHVATAEQSASGTIAAAVPEQAIPPAMVLSAKPSAVGEAPRIETMAHDAAHTLPPVNQADLQALSQRIDQKLAEMSRSVQDLHIASEDNRAALAALREERAARALPVAEPLRVVDAPDTPGVMPAVAAVAEPVATSEAVPEAPAASVNQSAAPTMNASARMHAVNASAASRRRIPAVVWLAIAALAIGILLMMAAPLRVLVQKLGDPATYSAAGSRLGDGLGGLNTGVSVLSDRIRSLVVR